MRRQPAGLAQRLKYVVNRWRVTGVSGNEPNFLLEIFPEPSADTVPC